MNEFMSKMYSYDNFGIYLICAIVILVILFFVILFFGKKDKNNRELEETKRLEKLNLDLFKEDSKEEKLETKEDSEVTPITNEITEEPILPIVDNSPEVPHIEDSLVPEVPTEENKDILEPINLNSNEPILEKEEEKPLEFNNLFSSGVLEEEEVNIDQPSSPVEEPTNNDNIELPEIPEFKEEEIKLDIDHILNNEKPNETLEKNTEPEKNVQVFSSVYVPLKEETEEVKNESNTEDTDDEDDFDLPQLKSSEDKKEEKPVEEEVKEEPFNTVNIDSISGESYEI
jgi:hypothetical protein